MDLQNRLTKNLLDLIESNNYYWDVIRKKNQTIALQQQDIKKLGRELKKNIGELTAALQEIYELKQQISHNHQKRTEH